jgi:hypothetical protein
LQTWNLWLPTATLPHRSLMHWETTTTHSGELTVSSILAEST